MNTVYNWFKSIICMIMSLFTSEQNLSQSDKELDDYIRENADKWTDP
jgi:hypothetical protein